MPYKFLDNRTNLRHTDDMQDIITAVPSWILRWGITLFFILLVLLLSLSAFIKYPDIVKTQLKITSLNTPKPVVPKITGKLVKLLISNNVEVLEGQPLAYIESTASHDKVLVMIARLKQMQKQINNGQSINNSFFAKGDNNDLGELQAAYQAFTAGYLTYGSSVKNGFLLKKRAFLQMDLASLKQQVVQLESEKSLQQRDLKLSEDEYSMHKKLEQQKVETPAELRLQESKYLQKKSPMLQTDGALITANSNLLAKQKEILELDNQVQEDISKFSQALNSLISQAEEWKAKYVLSATQAGRITYAGIIQQNQVITAGQDVFYVNADNGQYFGEMSIPQDNLGKVMEGQEVLVKLKSYPFEEYGMLRGRISYLADVPYHDSIFLSRVIFKSKMLSDLKKPVNLKQGMMADAEIITQDATILQRLSRNVIRAINSK